MSWDQIAGFIIAVIIVVSGLLFSTISEFERERRAANLSYVFTVIAAVIWIGIMYMAGEHFPYIVGAVLILGGAGVIAI